MNAIAVELTDLSKKYTLSHEKPTLMENIFSKKKKKEFWALKDINLVIKKGERVGIIGPNGSGKTTLLEVITGITTPTTGKALTKGKLVSLIELNAGFHPDLTGEENIYLNGLLIGMSKAELKSKFKKIVSFANIVGFIDTPMYTYSEGMKLRLGFSVIAHSDFDILILDELLAVGDHNFRRRSFGKIQEFFKQGKTVIVVSHDFRFLEDSCDRAIWLDKAKIKDDGNVAKVIKRYQQGLKNT